jgi:hypothetical protein
MRPRLGGAWWTGRSIASPQRASRTSRSRGFYADGENLHLRVARGGSKGWILRFTLAGRTRDAGLGSYPSVSLAEARREAE